jgi:hypothetical protein
LGITWGGLVGDRGHRKGQLLRVLGARQPFRAPHQGTQDRGATGGGRGRGVHGPDFFLSEGTKTGLQAPRANRYHPSYRQLLAAGSRQQTLQTHTTYDTRTDHPGPVPRIPGPGDRGARVWPTGVIPCFANGVKYLGGDLFTAYID